MTARPWRCDHCAATFRTFADLDRHNRSSSCAVRVSDAKRRRRFRPVDGASGGPVDRRRGVRVAHTLPADWTGDLDQPSLGLPGLVPLIIPGRAS